MYIYFSFCYAASNLQMFSCELYSALFFFLHLLNLFCKASLGFWILALYKLSVIIIIIIIIITIIIIIINHVITNNNTNINNDNDNNCYYKTLILITEQQEVSRLGNYLETSSE